MEKENIFSKKNINFILNAVFQTKNQNIYKIYDTLTKFYNEKDEKMPEKTSVCHLFLESHFLVILTFAVKFMKTFIRQTNNIFFLNI